ncbi:aldehyde dehydrogenase [Novosphingobium pentaromativorans US6-1]|nr:aldehyde dehydrogenase [Novosphingobium pentaromativorans US6-1]
MPMKPANISALPKPGFVIGGKKTTESSIGSYDHLYPANGQLTYAVPLGGKKEMDEAVAAARKAYPAWRAMPVNEKRKLMNRFAQVIRDHGEELKAIVMAENGSPHMMADVFPEWIADLFEYNAGWADKIGGDMITTWPAPAFDYTIDEPYGVIGIIVPWNGPAISFGQMIAPAMAVGNTCIIKPSEFAPYSCIRLGELALEAGIPEGVINVVPGGGEGGTALCSHPGVDKLHFTGGGHTAQKVLSAAQPNLTPVGLELGGKSARLVFADADRQTAIQAALMGCIPMSGQACIAGTRVLVEDSIFDSFVADVQNAASYIKVGDPADADTAMGPLIHKQQMDRVLGFVDRASSNGARIVSGGERLGGDLADGFFVGPTLVADVDASHEVVRDEVFGPVVSFMRFRDEEEAVRLANATPYGLAAYIESNDLKRVHRVAEALDAGSILVNNAYGLPVAAPFGGNKQSGVGRVGGIHGIREFVRTKNVYINMA